MYHNFQAQRDTSYFRNTELTVTVLHLSAVNIIQPHFMRYFTFRKQLIFPIQVTLKTGSCLYQLPALCSFFPPKCDSCWVFPLPHTHLQPKTHCCCSVCLKGTPLVEKGFRERKTGRSKKNQQRHRRDESC